MDRELLEPNLALSQRLTALTAGLAVTRNRQRWPGAIQQTTLEGGGAATTAIVPIIPSSLHLEPGSWFLIARVGVQISSTPGTPTFSGTEAFFVQLRVVNATGSALVEVLDEDVWSPATTPEAWTGGYYADSRVLFGSGTYEEPTIAQIVAYSDDTGAADHLVPWRAGKINALPF